MSIPQFRVYMSPDVDRWVLPVLQSGYITQGPKVEEFEESLKKELGFKYGLTVNSGTSALMLALRLAGVGPGKNVVSTPMTCSATNEAIVLMGADIIWADVDIYGNINPGSVLEKVNSTTAAVMAVDWGGLPCDYNRLRAVLDGIAGEGKRIPIIEDAAHAYLSEYSGRDVSQVGGDFVCYSFQAIKHLTTGDGGLVVCPDEETYERGKLLRWFGLDRTSSDAMRSKQDIKEVGYKFHLNDISAAIGLSNIPYAARNVNLARLNASFYDGVLSDYRPEWPENTKSSFWLYTIRVANPNNFEKWMGEKGIKVSQVHMRNDRYTCFFKYNVVGLKGLDKFSSTMVCIPVGWWLTESDLDWISECIVFYQKIHGRIQEW